MSSPWLPSQSTDDGGLKQILFSHSPEVVIPKHRVGRGTFWKIQDRMTLVQESGINNNPWHFMSIVLSFHHICVPSRGITSHIPSPLGFAASHLSSYEDVNYVV